MPYWTKLEYRNQATAYFQEPRGNWVFRGHSDEAFKLIPSVGRGPRSAPTIEKHEQSLFAMFRREAVTYLTSIPHDEWEWLSLAQHHGLPTRFLDWSHNLLVALYFAASASPEKDGTLFALHSQKKIAETRLQVSPLNLMQPEKYYPALVTPRIRVQEGLFIACGKPHLPLDECLRKNWSIEQMRIPADEKPRIVYELFRIGVHSSSLFPDIDGLTSRIRWQHGVSSPLRDAFAMPATVIKTSSIT